MRPDRPVFRIVTSAGEAEEHLRVIRQAMERSTKYSTLSGLSGIAVGLLALAGCWVTQSVLPGVEWPLRRVLFAVVWVVVLLLAFGADFVFTKRRAALVGKTPFSPLGKHLARAAAPGFAAGLALSLFYFLYPGLIGGYLYGFWMLCYGVAVLSVGMFSRREVSVLGWAFLLAGAATLLLPRLLSGAFPTPTVMMAVAFGGFHIAYGIWMGVRYGW